MFVVVGILAVLVATALLISTSPPSNVDTAPMSAAETSAPADQKNILSPPVPAFYDVAGIALGSNGSMIQSEPVAGPDGDIDLYRIMYRSTDNSGRSTPVTGLFAVPKSPPPPGGFPLIAYAHGTTGSNPSCGISIAPNEPNTAGYGALRRQIAPLVEQGWAVVATDYLGMGAPGTPSYLVGEVEGRNVLDSVRAVHGGDLAPVDKSRTVVWGHSQGGQSAAFTGLIAPRYAPEIEIDGIAMLAPGLIPTLPAALNAITAGTKPTGKSAFIMLIANSWLQTYPDMITADSALTQKGVSMLPVVAEQCGSTLTETFMQEGISTYVNNPIEKPFYPVNEINTPATSFDYPLIMVQGMKDTTIIPLATLAYVQQLCNAGQTLDYRIYTERDHGGVVVASRDLIDSWIADRFADKPAPTTCSNR